MLTAIEIENFKAFGDSQRIELAPLTLLFGPNSGGKSSIIHALHYAREIMLGRGCDVHRTESGGDLVDLGGFENLIHQSTSNTDLTDLLGVTHLEPNSRKESATDDPIRLSFEVRNQKPEEDWEGELQSWYNEYMDQTGPHGHNNWDHISEDGELELLGISSYGRYLFTSAKTCRVTVTMNRRKVESGITTYEVMQYDVAYDGVPLVRKERIGTFSWGLYLDIRLFSDPSLANEGTEHVVLSHGWQSGVLPRWGQEVSHKQLLEKLAPEEDAESEQPYGPICLSHWLTRLVAGPGELVRNHLRELRYVGPLRSIPSRVTATDEPVGASQWPSGLAAWGELEETDFPAGTSETSLVKLVSEALESSDMLDTGYALDRVPRAEITTSVLRFLLTQVESDENDLTAETLMAKVRDQFSEKHILLRGPGGNLLEPHDVGVGISQVVPVLVACLAWRMNSIIAIEQPELHLHPKQQAALGDILIRATRPAFLDFEKERLAEAYEEPFSIAQLARRNVIIETHSEHLILRILRRIRETAQSIVPPDNACTPDDLSVLYVEQNPNLRSSEVRRMLVDTHGHFIDPWPDSFFDQDSEERFS